MTFYLVVRENNNSEIFLSIEDAKIYASKNGGVVRSFITYKECEIYLRSRNRVTILLHDNGYKLDINGHINSYFVDYLNKDELYINIINNVLDRYQKYVTFICEVNLSNLYHSYINDIESIPNDLKIYTEVLKRIKDTNSEITAVNSVTTDIEFTPQVMSLRKR